MKKIMVYAMFVIATLALFVGCMSTTPSSQSSHSSQHTNGCH